MQRLQQVPNNEIELNTRYVFEFNDGTIISGIPRQTALFPILDQVRTFRTLNDVQFSFGEQGRQRIMDNTFFRNLRNVYKVVENDDIDEITNQLENMRPNGGKRKTKRHRKNKRKSRSRRR